MKHRPKLEHEDAPITQLELVEHLAELRTRLMRALIYACVGMIVGWVLYDFFFNLISNPVREILHQQGSKFLLTHPAEGFTIKMQMSLLIGITLAMPLFTLELWGFISPGLTTVEKRGALLVAPLSILLFAGGVLLAYVVLPTGMRWLIGQNPTEATFMPSVQGTLLFILKMYLAFGIVFQMPVILMFLAKIGIVSSGMLKAQWRYAVVAIGIIAAVITPSGDAFTMAMMAVPMVVLYILSIGLVRIVER